MNSNESNFNINDFSKSQLEEIQKGLEQKLNVSVYAKKEFLAIQMRQIRLGLQDKLPVEKYANPSFDWFQMEQIRMGLKDGIDLFLYWIPWRIKFIIFRFFCFSQANILRHKHFHP